MSGPVGLVPAAGRGTRISPLPCSKEILPVGVELDGGGPVVEPACRSLLRAMARAGVSVVHVVLGHGKWDIPAYLGDGSELGLDLGYLTIEDSPGAPYTVDRAYRFTRDRDVVFGFPDIVFQPVDALARLHARRHETAADVVLGLFPAQRPEKMDMVETDLEGRVTTIDVKPAATALTHAWILAAWGSRFTEHLHEFVAHATGAEELHVGDVVRAAIAGGLRVIGEPFPSGTYRDVGTPEDLAAALRGNS